VTFVKPQPATNEKGDQTHGRMLGADILATRFALRVGSSVFDLRLRRAGVSEQNRQEVSPWLHLYHWSAVRQTGGEFMCRAIFDSGWCPRSVFL
jgi:hypothetical protein